jgi:hypothetical protein
MTRRLIADESGVALVIAIVTMLVLGALTSALLFSVAVNHQSSAQTSNAERAFGLAEEGIAYAEGRLYAAPVTGLTDPSTLPGPGTPFDSAQGWTYSGTYDSSAKVWTLTGNGTYNRVGRTVVVQVPVNILNNTVVHDDTAVYQYMFADTSNCTTPANLLGNGAITVPLYANGCVYFSDHTQFKGNDLEVGVNLNMGSNAGVGTSTQKIGKMNVGGACMGRVSSCGNGSTDPIWANSVGSTLSPPLGTLHLPTITLVEQTPTCGAGSTGVPANFFDTDSAVNNPTRQVNLFPAGAPYDCKIDANNEISWDGSRNFTVRANRAFYFDGSLSMSGQQQVIYTGSAAIFFSGTINMSGQAWICGVTGVTTTTSHGNTSYSCNTQWDPAGSRNGGITNQLVLVAGCYANSSMTTQVTYAATGTYCVDLSGQNTFQVGTVLNQDYHSGGLATNYGPVVANTLTVAGNPGQLLPFSTLPAGAPTTNTTVTTSITGGKPYNWNG